ncbi:class I SAM-dependent methyltransferase [Microbacterium tumbae]
MNGFAYERLRRAPDVEAANLFAYDQTDRLLVDRSLTAVPSPQAREIAVIGDGYGALTLALVDAGLSGVRVHQDLATGRRALARNARALGLAWENGDEVDAARHVAPGRTDEGLDDLGYPAAFTTHELDASLFDGARLVLLRLPKSLAELEEIADAVARWATDDVVLIAGGRVKHMTLAQNEVLGRYFGSVQAQRAERKSRLVVAARPRPVADAPPFPVRSEHPEFELALLAHGGAFAGARIDIGTRVLLEVLAEERARSGNPDRGDVDRRVEPGHADADALHQGFPTTRDAPVVVDLGCGTGALAAFWALGHPEARVIATDRSAAAVASARATVVANGLAGRVAVTHDDAGSGIPDASADVVLLNPPFHLGTSVHTGAATRLFEAAARILRPGGELLTVYNSSLGYRSELARLVGPTEQLRRTPKFTVTRSVRR